MAMTHERNVVLITGAAQGIGRVVAAGFAQSGWDVAVAEYGILALTKRD